MPPRGALSGAGFTLLFKSTGKGANFVYPVDLTARIFLNANLPAPISIFPGASTPLFRRSP
ncbi:hypothetical protein GHC20_06265 [Brucella sp. 2280]|nr:hypothetical protein GHC20_06265 [Brucella sp. 2280]